MRIKRGQLALQFEKPEISEVNLRAAHASTTLRLSYEEAIKDRKFAVCLKNLAMLMALKKGGV